MTIMFDAALKPCTKKRRQDIKIIDVAAGTDLRVSPWVHQAGVLHTISPITMKLGQFEESTPKLKMTNWFVVWIFMVGDSAPNWFN